MTAFAVFDDGSRIIETCSLRRKLVELGSERPIQSKFLCSDYTATAIIRFCLAYASALCIAPTALLRLWPIRNRGIARIKQPAAVKMVLSRLDSSITNLST